MLDEHAPPGSLRRRVRQQIADDIKLVEARE
jgi:hypothetical protein